jgi:hypothetical protein
MKEQRLPYFLVHRSDFIIPNGMPGVGLEPTCLAAYDFESYASANSATPAFSLRLLKATMGGLEPPASTSAG